MTWNWNSSNKKADFFPKSPSLILGKALIQTQPDYKAKLGDLLSQQKVNKEITSATEQVNNRFYLQLHCQSQIPVGFEAINWLPAKMVHEMHLIQCFNIC